MLATRFTPDHGYLIESRRGGGGYIRIVRVMQPQGQHLLYLVNERLNSGITATEARRLLSQLTERGVMTPDEGTLAAAAVSDQALSLPLPDTMKDLLRARILKAMFMDIARKNRERGENGENP